MSICSGAVDGPLMSKSSFVLIIRYLDDFKVGSLNRFSIDGRTWWEISTAVMREDIFLKMSNQKVKRVTN